MPTYRKLLSGVMSGLSLGTHVPNLKFVPLAVLELLAFNAPKFTGSRDSHRDHAHFSETLVRDMSGLSLGTHLPNLKFAPLAVLELLAINRQKIMRSREPGNTHISEAFVRSHVGTIPGNTRATYRQKIYGVM